MIGLSNIVLIFIWGISVPFVLGMLWEKLLADSGRICRAGNFVLGFMTMAAVFQVLAVPMIFLRAPFHVLKYVWIAVIACLLIASVLFNYKDFKGRLKNSISIKKPERAELIIWLAVVVIVVFQTYLLAGHMHVDTDDARFVAEALEAVEKDTMLQYHPLTGEFLGSPLGEMNKDVTSPYPIFLGLIGELFRLPPAVAAHMILPVLLIPLCYAVYFVIGSWFFDGSRDTGLFLLFLGLIHLFSFESIFASGYTLLTIIWQGRSVAAMILLPLLWYVLLRMTGQAAVRPKDYVLLAATLIACAMLSGMGVLLSLLLALAYACVCAFQKKSLRTALWMLLCMCPNIVNLIISRYLL